MQDFKKLNVWMKAHRLTLAIYKATKAYPPEERYGLVSQMRRAASSIAYNIAEACGRGGQKEFARFLRNSTGSASELEYQLILSRDLQMLTESAAKRLGTEVEEVRRMLAGLLRRAASSEQDGSRRLA